MNDEANRPTEHDLEMFCICMKPDLEFTKSNNAWKCRLFDPSFFGSQTYYGSGLTVTKAVRDCYLEYLRKAK